MTRALRLTLPVHTLGMILGLIGSLIFSGTACAELPAKLSIDGQTWPRRGEGTATYLWFDVYDAGLYTPKPVSAARVLEPDTPRALVLHYHQRVSAAQIREASQTVLERQYDPSQLAALQPALDALESSMQSVQPGDRYTLIWQPPRLILQFNQRTVFSREDAALAQAYFGIWLGASPLSESLKAALLPAEARASAQ
ncbi:chalcone isomerase family protein [Halothiobacillus sp. DCM-1]|uniref:chalcone isomerase family protein n=1 Tax=Halothiobacillus sp. DCM-1 TaxID=3112558 RepID=UPI00324469D7